MSLIPVAGYSAYEAGDAIMPYSLRHTASLSVREALAMPIPSVLPAGALSFVKWSVKIPQGGILHSLDPTVCIPHYEDVRQFFSEQPGKYLTGSRSVVVIIHGKLTFDYCSGILTAYMCKQVIHIPFILETLAAGPTLSLCLNALAKLDVWLTRSHTLIFYLWRR